MSITIKDKITDELSLSESSRELEKLHDYATENYR
jgi:hypothetical protein